MQLTATQMESPSIKTKHGSTLGDLLARLSQCSFLDPSEDKVVSQFAVGRQGVDVPLSLLLLPAPQRLPLRARSFQYPHN